MAIEFTAIGNSTSVEKKWDHGSTNWYQKYIITATLKAIDKTNMTATVNVKGRLVYKYCRWANVDKTFSLLVNGNALSTTKSISGGGNENTSKETEIFSINEDVILNYNSDGTLSATFGGKVSGESHSAAPSNTTFSTDTVIFPKLELASTFTLSGSTLGSAVTVTIDRQNDLFTHKVEYSFAGSSYEPASQSNVATSATFTPALSLASNVPNAPSGTLTVKVTTFNGTVQICSPVIDTCTLAIPKTADTLPTAGTLVATASSDHSVIKTWGNIFVQGYSKATISFSGAAGKQGATISQYAVGGDKLDINNSSTTNSFTTGVLNTQKVTFSGKVIDSRGFEGLASPLTIILYEYSEPTITVKVSRCDSNGIENLQGTYLKIEPKIIYSEVGGKNSIKTKTISCNGVSNTTFTSDQSFVLAANVATTSSYNLTASVTDAVGNSNSITIKIWNSNNVPLHINENKNGMGIGTKAGDSNALKLGWTLDVNNNDIKNAKMTMSNNISVKSEIVNLIYPVGSIYISANSANPGTFLGGTWAAFAAGRCIVGVGTSTGADGGTLSVTNGQNFGSVNHTHTTGDCTLTIDQMPSHTHIQDAHNHAQHNNTFMNDSSKFDTRPSGSNGYYMGAGLKTYYTQNATATNQNTGGGQAHNHGNTGSGTTSQPSIGVYMWKRTA